MARPAVAAPQMRPTGSAGKEAKRCVPCSFMLLQVALRYVHRPQNYDIVSPLVGMYVLYNVGCRPLPSGLLMVSCSCTYRPKHASLVNNLTTLKRAQTSIRAHRGRAATLCLFPRTMKTPNAGTHYTGGYWREHPHHSYGLLNKHKKEHGGTAAALIEPVVSRFALRNDCKSASAAGPYIQTSPAPGPGSGGWGAARPWHASLFPLCCCVAFFGLSSGFLQDF